MAGGAWEPALGPAREDGRLVAESAEPATMAKLTELPRSLDPGLVEALSRVGIESLYSHQAAAYETAGHSHLILTSGTASGKSLSFNLPVLNGIEATRQITSSAESAGVRVIILTTFDLDDYVFGALRAGASGFLLKDTLPEDLITAIRVVAAGEALLAPSVTRRLISEFAKAPALGAQGPAAPGLPAAPRLPALPGDAVARPGGTPAARAGRVTGLLTEREREVLRLVTAGMSNGEIADHLRISPATAKTHVAHLLTKLDARDRVQLVIIAYQAGLAPPAA